MGELLCWFFADFIEIRQKILKHCIHQPVKVKVFVRRVYFVFWNTVEYQLGYTWFFNLDLFFSFKTPKKIFFFYGNDGLFFLAISTSLLIQYMQESYFAAIPVPFLLVHFQGWKLFVGDTCWCEWILPTGGGGCSGPSWHSSPSHSA